MTTISSLSLRRSLHEPTDDDGSNIDWTLALAGGEGLRLQDYVARHLGERISKQYCRLIGTGSLLEETLDRMNQITPPSRTLTVIGTGHAEWARPQLEGRSDHVFCQPSSRDTAVATYVALAMIKRWHPNATVTIVPTDHHVAPTSRYLDAVRAARAFAARACDLVVLLVVEPTDPDPDLGYIVSSVALADEPDVGKVATFVEKKPPPAHAAALCDARRALEHDGGVRIGLGHVGARSRRRTPPAGDPRLAGAADRDRGRGRGDRVRLSCATRAQLLARHASARCTGPRRCG